MIDTPNQQESEPMYHGDKKPENPQDGDCYILFRPEYNRWELLMYDPYLFGLTHGGWFFVVAGTLAEVDAKGQACAS